MFTLRDLKPRQFKCLADEDVLSRVVRVGTQGQEILSQPGRMLWLGDHRMRDTTSLDLSSTQRLERMMHNAAMNRNMVRLEDATGLPTLKVLEAVMVAMMVRSGGVGLAAQQVGLDMQAFVMGTTPFPKSKWTPYKPRLFVNPELLDADGRRLGWESCLSVTNDLARPLPEGAAPMDYLRACAWRDSIRLRATTALSNPGAGQVSVGHGRGIVGNLYGLVPRPSSIRVGYYDSSGTWREETFKDDLARIWLHEHGHAVLGQLYPFLVHEAGTRMVISKTYGEVEEGTEVDVEQVVGYLRNNVATEGPADRLL